MSHFKVDLSIPLERVRDLLISAFEGGSNYWIDEVRRDYNGLDPSLFGKGGEFEAKDEFSTYDSLYALPFHPKTRLLVIPEDYDHDGETEFTVNLEAIQKGLQVMSEKYPHHFKNFLEENDDAETADVFLQCICFGEIVFG